MVNEPGETIGLFLGVESSNFEYLASIIAPYQIDYSPLMGGFILIDDTNEYIVARIMDYIPQGEIVSYWGKKWLSEVALTPDVIGQDIKTRKISYQVKIKLLGRLNKDLTEFTPGIKTIPHITSKVIQPSSYVIETICNQALIEMKDGIEIGDYWLDPNVKIHFNMKELIGKRTFIFARAGFGKSNLMKVFASNWKKEYGSLIIFDPEGEYSITDKKNRPGIMDQIPAILITNRKGIRNYLNANIYDKLKFDFRSFHPKFIVPIIVSEQKYEMVFFNKLMSLNKSQWSDLIDYLNQNRYRSDYETIAEIMGIKYEKPVDITPILNNLIPPMDQLHDPDSKLFLIIEKAVERNLPIIIDISLLGSHNALTLSSLIISKFFRQNQKRFIAGRGDLNQITFVVEEAQSVIGGKTNIAKFVELAKEGRKYQLGGIFITQQPGSISMDILSQGDNFFVFHLLSKEDLKALQKANAHFSNDILTQILSEPIKGKAYMWTSNQPFSLSVRIENFETIAKPRKSYEIQSKNNLLDEILYEITKFDEIEVSIINKLKIVLDEKKIEILDRKTIFSNEIERVLTKQIFQHLSKLDINYINELDGLTKNENEEPYALSYIYFSELYQKAIIYFKNKNTKEIISENSKKTLKNSKNPSNGYCIRCHHDKISYDLDKPFCNSCYKAWELDMEESDLSNGENKSVHDDYEKYCHFCGKESKTTYFKPLCDDCLKLNQ